MLLVMLVVFILCIALLGRECILGVMTLFISSVCTVHLEAVMVCHELITKGGRVTTMLWYVLFVLCPPFDLSVGKTYVSASRQFF